MKTVTKIGDQLVFPTPKHKLRVAAYCRVSTDSEEQLVSLATQRKHYESYITANPDWEFAGIYYDEGITGTKKEKRPALLRLIDDCEHKKIDFIVTKSISRFARNTTDCLELVRKLLEHTVYIYFEKENLNTGSMESELMLSILSGLAENESVSIAENSTWAIQRRFQNGTFKLAYAPYGYDVIEGKLVLQPEQATIVKAMFDQTLAGIGTDAIAKELNAKEIPAKRGTHWTATTIRGILKNENYTGDAIFQKTYTDSHFNRLLIVIITMVRKINTGWSTTTKLSSPRTYLKRPSRSSGSVAKKKVRCHRIKSTRTVIRFLVSFDVINVVLPSSGGSKAVAIPI